MPLDTDRSGTTSTMSGTESKESKAWMCICAPDHFVCWHSSGAMKDVAAFEGKLEQVLGKVLGGREPMTEEFGIRST